MRKTQGTAVPPWHASGTFWTIVSVVVAVLAIGFSAWAAWRSAHPRKRLHVWIGSDTPLMTREAEYVSVSHRGTRLTDPRVVRVFVAVRSRRDISPADFTGPIRIALGTPIVQVLAMGTSTSRAALPAPDVRNDGDALVIDPTLLPGDQLVILDVLVDAIPELALTAPLLNVETNDRAVPATTVDPVIKVLPLVLVVLSGLVLGVPIATFAYFPLDQIPPGGTWPLVVLCTIAASGLGTGITLLIRRPHASTMDALASFMSRATETHQVRIPRA